MRTSRLRRWVLRGVLFSAVAATPLALASAAQADWSWNRDPQVVTVDSNSSDDATIMANGLGDDWSWN